MNNCAVCNTDISHRRGNTKYCSKKCYNKHFDTKFSQQKKIRKFPWIIYKKDKCEHCGFIPLHLCQLDVDHIDGNKKNNNIDNLQTLCANCHRLKTQLNRDWDKR